MKDSTKRAIGAAGIAICGALLFGPMQATAQTWPTRTVTLIYPFPGGSPGDVAMRVISSEISKPLGQTVIVENRPGSGGYQGVNAMKTAAPDGYTLTFMNVGNIVVRPAADPSFPFELGKDYQAVIAVWETYDYVYANAAAPYKDLRGLIAYAKANPGKLDLAHGGIGGSGHIALEAFLAESGVNATIIPYKGASDLIAATVAGQVPVMFIGSKLQQYVDAGKLTALAYSGPQRNPEFPTIPTIAEAGVPSFTTVGNWVGVLAPAATPRPVINRLNETMNAALKVPMVAEKVLLNGYPVGGTPEQAAQRIKTGIEKFGPMLRKLNLKFE